ncbi:MAG TPA: killer suppression protein HigA [bacterium]
MNIQFADKKMLKSCSDPLLASKAWGQRGAKIRQRLDEFRAAVSLKDIAMLPAARLHPLKGNRSGQFAVDIIHPFRLVFEPVGSPNDLNDVRGNLDLKKVKTIRILEVVDYHD